MSRALLLSLLLLAACGDPCPTEMGLPDGGVHGASAVDSGAPDLTSAREALPSCDPEWDPECGADGGGGGTITTPTGTVSVTFVNALPVQATFYADGGGYYATTSYHQTIWLAAGGRTTIQSAMSGPAGVTLTTSTMLAAQGFPHYTLTGSLVVERATTTCTVTATMHPEGYAYLTQACQ